MFARLSELSRAERGARISESLAVMGLPEAADRLVQTYSGGMIRRLEIALSILHRPLLRFPDEPTIGLDPLAGEAVWEHLDRLRGDVGTTILLTTHDMDEAEHQCVVWQSSSGWLRCLAFAPESPVMPSEVEASRRRS